MVVPRSREDGNRRSAFDTGSAKAMLRIAVSRPRSMRRARRSARFWASDERPFGSRWTIATRERSGEPNASAACFSTASEPELVGTSPPVADAGRSLNDGSAAVARTAAAIQAGTTSSRSRTSSHANAALMRALLPVGSRFYAVGFAGSADDRGDVLAVGLALVLVQRVRIELVLPDLAAAAEVERGEDRSLLV